MTMISEFLTQLTLLSEIQNPFTLFLKISNIPGCGVVNTKHPDAYASKIEIGWPSKNEVGKQKI